MRGIFVSYARKDLQRAQLFLNGLESSGLEYFADFTSINAGENWAKQIDQAIDEAEHFFFLVSKNSFESEEVQRELRAAVAANKKIVPIYLENVESDQFPELLRNYENLEMRPGRWKAFQDIYERSVSGDAAYDANTVATNKGYVFLSYASDDIAFTQEIRTFLRERGYAYWDYEESDRDYHNQLFLELEEVMLNSAAVFSILSESWKKSKWTVREYFFAEEASVPVFLLKAKSIGPTLAIAGIPYIDFTTDSNAGWAKLDRELVRKGL